MTPAAPIERSPDAETVWFGADCVVFDRASNTVRRLNATAAAVWLHLDRAQSRADVVSMVLGDASAPIPGAADEVLGFCDELLAWGLAREVTR